MQVAHNLTSLHSSDEPLMWLSLEDDTKNPKICD